MLAILRLGLMFASAAVQISNTIFVTSAMLSAAIERSIATRPDRAFEYQFDLVVDHCHHRPFHPCRLASAMSASMSLRGAIAWKLECH
jgi:hypothetical protein